jgi:hypothetical protein
LAIVILNFFGNKVVLISLHCEWKGKLNDFLLKQTFKGCFISMSTAFFLCNFQVAWVRKRIISFCLVKRKLFVKNRGSGAKICSDIFLRQPPF